MIRDSNIDPQYSQFARQVFSLPASANSTSVEAQGSVVLPWPFKIVSAVMRALSVTDGGSVDLQVDGESVASASITDTSSVAMTPASYDTVYPAGSHVVVVPAAPSGDAIDGAVTLEVRPLLGSQERVSNGLGDF